MDIDKRIVINMDDKRHLTYNANFDDMNVMLQIMQMILSVLADQIKKRTLN